MSVAFAYVNGDAREVVDFAARGIDRLFVAIDAAIGVPHAIWLVGIDGKVVRITCEMVVVEHRFEVGRLALTIGLPQPPGIRHFDLPSEWRGVSAVELFSVRERPPWSKTDEGAIDVEAGLLFHASPHQIWSIVVGAQPCTLAINAPFVPIASDPQYASDDYRVRPLVA